MFYTVSTPPDHLAGGAGDPPIVTAALPANQKAAQYALGVVPGGLSFACIFIVEASLAFLKLYGKVVIKAKRKESE